MVHAIARLTLFPIYRLWVRDVKGLENVPQKGGFIIAANHSSYYDAVLLHSILVPKIKIRIHAFVNNSYWKYPIIRNFLNVGGGIPVYYGKNDKFKNEKSFETALKLINGGGIMEIFPEGARSKDGELKKAYTGIARLALTAKAPVLPVGIINSNKVIPKGKLLPRFAKCSVKIGKMVYLTNYYDKNLNTKILEDATRKIMKEIAKLIGQKYNH